MNDIRLFSILIIVQLSLYQAISAEDTAAMQRGLERIGLLAGSSGNLDDEQYFEQLGLAIYKR
jgi:hypothetical protein